MYRQGTSQALPVCDELRRTPLMPNLIGAYALLKQDLARIFEFVEPYPDNYDVFSHRIFELLLRACTEVEAVCKIMFAANGITLGPRDANMIRYSDLESATRLSEFSIVCTALRDLPFSPFASKASVGSKAMMRSEEVPVRSLKMGAIAQHWASSGWLRPR
jgi:hypothetical protein